MAVAQLFLTLRPRGLEPTGSVSVGVSRQEYWSGLPCPPPGDLSHPGVKPRPPTLQADSLPAEPRGKFTNTGVGSLSILQGIFPSKGSNLGLLHCRLILHYLRHQGPVFITKPLIKMQIYIFESSRIHQRSHWPKSFVSLLWSFLVI